MWGLGEVCHLSQECASGGTLRLFLSKPFPSPPHSRFPLSPRCPHSCFFPEQEARRPSPAIFRGSCELTTRVPHTAPLPGWGFLPARRSPVPPRQLAAPFFPPEWLRLETPLLPLPGAEAAATSLLTPTSHCFGPFFQISHLLPPSHLFPFHLRREGASVCDYAQFPLPARGGFCCFVLAS